MILCSYFCLNTHQNLLYYVMHIIPTRITIINNQIKKKKTSLKMRRYYFDNPHRASWKNNYCYSEYLFRLKHICIVIILIFREFKHTSISKISYVCTFSHFVGIIKYFKIFTIFKPNINCVFYCVRVFF